MKYFTLDRCGQVVVVTFDKPPANTIDEVMLEELDQILGWMEDDDGARSIVFASDNEKMFMAGQDVGEMRTWGRDSKDVASRLSDIRRVFDRLEGLEKPTIGIIGGHALGGGCEFALCLDFRVMARGRARIGLPEVGLGIVPGGGGTQRLARLVGRGKAMEMLMLGSRLDADEAGAVGLVGEVCEDRDEALRRGMELGEYLAGQAPLAVRLIKRSVNEGSGRPLAEGLDIEQEAAVAALISRDAEEGVSAFLEKRGARFIGR